MPRIRLTGLLAAGVLLAVAAPAAAAPATVTVRVEGKADTLVPRTAVTTTTAPVNKDGRPGHECSGTSVAGALEQATGGAWTGSWDQNFSQYLITAIEGETPAAPAEFYSLWVNGKEATVGACQYELQQGDDVLFYVARCDAGPPPDFACANPPVYPLVLTVPATATAGTPFTVKVVELAPDGTAAPAAGATVSGGGVSATTGADGTAGLTLGAPATLRATKENRARSAAEAVQVAAVLAPPVESRAPRLASAITSVREQQRFARSRAPRTLRGSVVADAGVVRVRLRLTRNDRGRCQTFDGARERFVRLSRCGATRGRWFTVGDRAQWSYLLPARLGRGRWVLDVEATDRTGRRTTPARGTTRVVFHVR